MDLRVVVSTRAPGLLARVTEERSDLRVDAYPVGHLLLLRCAGGGRDPPDEDVWGSSDREVLWTQPGPDGELTVLLSGGREPEVVGALLAEGVHLVPPVRWSRGEATLTLLVPGGGSLEEVLELFPEARLVSKTRVQADATGPGSSRLLLGDLTEKQARALLHAHERGYYELPRRVTTGELASDLGVARSTFEQHLNRAEGRVVASAVPMLRLRAGGEPRRAAEAGALETFSRYSRELDLHLVMRLSRAGVRELTLASEPPPDASDGSHPYLDRVADHVRYGDEDLSDVPVDVETPGFHREVLSLLRTIPPGQTLTYGEVARELGSPGAARAVGNACAANPALVVIPCHRVVPSSGGVGNYAGAGGSETKRRLLEIEGALSGVGP